MTDPMAPPVVDTEATLQRTVTDEDIIAFAGATLDDNPLHLDDAYAATTRFGRRIAHGMLCASMFSAILGTHMPGKGTVYLEQSLKFIGPVA